jgi:predicted Zn-dependent protease
MHPIQQNTHALRWMTSPVNIYVQTDDALGLNDSVIRQALEAWQSSVAITRVAKAQDADIVVETSLPGPSKGPVTYPVFQAGNTANKMRTIMLINLTQYRQLGPLPLAASRLQAALTHQLGHALGLWGHSTQPTDIMYPGEAIEAHDLPDSWSTTKASPVPVYKAIGSRSVMPSPRDTATLQRIYTRPGRDLGEMLPFEEP